MTMMTNVWSARLCHGPLSVLKKDVTGVLAMSAQRALATDDPDLDRRAVVVRNRVGMSLAHGDALVQRPLHGRSHDELQGPGFAGRDPIDGAREVLALNVAAVGVVPHAHRGERAEGHRGGQANVDPDLRGSRWSVVTHRQRVGEILPDPNR